MDVPSPSKRPRTDSDAPPTSTPIRSSIWMAYGDIVLQAEFTQFRISRDILAAQSPVFHNMFSVPQPTNQPTVDGCSVAQVFGDSAKEWELLLQALYHPFQTEALPFDLLAVMLRLGKKYAMDTIKKSAVALVNYEYPNDLSLWSQRGDRFTKIQFQLGLMPDLLNLAHECGIKSIFPPLAFDLLNGPGMESLINDEVLRKDGSRVILAPPLKFMLAVAASRLWKHQTSLFQPLDRDGEVIPSKDCTSSVACAKQRGKVFRHINRGGYFSSLKAWESRWSNKFCTGCDAAGKAAFEANRVKTWNMLPSFFGLPNWEDLKDDD